MSKFDTNLSDFLTQCAHYASEVGIVVAAQPLRAGTDRNVAIAEPRKARRRSRTSHKNPQISSKKKSPHGCGMKAKRENSVCL